MESVYLDFPEGQLHVLTAGEAGRPVLLLSGAGLDNARLSWRHLMPALAATHRVYAIDWPKQGDSRPWRGRASHDRLLRLIREVLDHFRIERVSLVGLSQGGALALAFAIAAPERVDRIVAIAPAGTISFPPGLHQLLWLTARLSPLTTAVSTLLLRHRGMVALFARRGLFAGPVDDFDQIVDEIHREVLRGGAGASDWQNDSIGFRGMKINLLPDLPRLASPVLLIQGDQDVAVKPHFTKQAARRLPDAKLVLLEDHGHWPNRQSPELVNHLIVDFLAET
jgi:pimeloyl-ACP methyl ester carboxylesterase